MDVSSLRLRCGLVKLWGAPVAARVGVKDGFYWQDRDAGVQAVLEPSGTGRWILQLWPFMPWKKFLGTSPTELGIETRPILGTSEQELMKEYAHLFPKKISDDRIDLQVHGYEFHAMHVPLILGLEGGKVTQIFFTMPYGNHPDMKADLEAGFKAKFGEPKRVDKMYTTWREQDPYVQMDHSAGAAQFAFWIKPKF